jgi:hypothetical protein
MNNMISLSSCIYTYLRELCSFPFQYSKRPRLFSKTDQPPFTQLPQKLGNGGFCFCGMESVGF